ncbi:MAG TPA: DedA family protein [Gaiellaceae bacterium]|nr:DedA family protein [Gaiellaceae bacterium]
MTSLLADYGVLTVLVLMAIDAVFPAASELVMVYGGALASGALTHDLHVFGWHTSGAKGYVVVVVAGVIGYQVGAIVGYELGARGGRGLLARRGAWLHLSTERLDRAERWFDRWGTPAVLLGRITPLVRSFVSIPAGVFGVPRGRYNLFTLVGNAVWCMAFAGIGWGLGASWDTFHKDFRFVDYAVVAGVVLLALALLLRLRRRRPATIHRS